jgi:hypothetical protein
MEVGVNARIGGIRRRCDRILPSIPDGFCWHRQASGIGESGKFRLNRLARTGERDPAPVVTRKAGRRGPVQAREETAEHAGLPCFVFAIPVSGVLRVVFTWGRQDEWDPSTLIPLRVVHGADCALDGGNPAILTGYGSYGFVARRLFSPEMLAWYERGGVYAAAGLRGGGEYGREWHQAGRGACKENTITDFIDCAEYLIKQGYTSPERLAGDGTSAGGIPVGGALVRRPDLWGAMVMRVACVNTTRMEFSENGLINVPEFGSITTEQGLHDLLITDCYCK